MAQGPPGRTIFAAVAAAARRVLRLKREVAAAKAERLGTTPYEALLDQYEPGGSVALIDRLFGELAAFLPDLIEAILDRQAAAAAAARSLGSVSDRGARRAAAAG